jgi:Rod binding domain-containing protein
VTAPIIGPTPAPKAESAAKDKAKAAAEMKQAAAAFEAILVRQMLASAQVAGKGSYADMGVEALSTAVQQGGGLGLGHAIERAIGAAHPGPIDASTPSASKK